jgi:hypothetical protein
MFDQSPALLGFVVVALLIRCYFRALTAGMFSLVNVSDALGC